MTPEERLEIERNLALTAAVNAETAEIQKRIATNLVRLVTSLEAMEINLNAFITESREGRKNLQAELEAFLQAGRKNGKS